MTAAGELNEMFGLQVAAVPTNKPSRRRDRPAELFFSSEEKLAVGGGATWCCTGHAPRCAGQAPRRPGGLQCRRSCSRR
jgi:hypothetical protein